MSRPDTALRRSDELMAVGQPAAALSSVSEIFSSKRFRSTPLSSLEPIIIRFLELCVMLRKGRTAKEGLHLFKNVAQNTSVSSVETAIRHFLDKSKEKLDEALAKVEEQTNAAAAQKEDGNAISSGNDVEDLEASETPESILLSTVSDEKSKDRTYRTLVTPWLRFLWEAYRTALDILRNNARLEVLYQQVALEAFSFCLTHTRKTEFRRLAETLRNHFSNAQKYAQQSYAINISDPETLQRHLDIRFAQLNTAVELELWQEAFRSAEDIHGLVAASKRTPRASMMASFYEKLVRVFAVGQNFTFHAAAYGKLWSLQAASAPSGKAVDGESTSSRIAGLVLLSALSVPLAAGAERKTRKDPVTGEERDATRGRMTLMGLLDLPSVPTRASLINDALKRGILKSVSPELRNLYNIIEGDFHPLHITAKLEPIFAFLRSQSETVRYIEPLKNVVLSRLFQQLGQVYDSVKLARVVKLATFKDDDADSAAGSPQVRIEKFITDACRRGEMTVRLDHNEGVIEFDEKVFDPSNEESGAPVASSSVDVLQPTPSTLLRTHVTRLAQTLFVSLQTISPNDSALAIAQKQAQAALQAMAQNLAADREAVLARRLISDQRKQRAEAEQAKKDKDNEAARIAARQQAAATEAKRVETEARARQLEIIRKNNDAVKAEEARKLAEKLKNVGALKVPVKDLENMDSAALMKIQVEQMEKEKKELAEKLRIVGRRMDHTERAFRKEEVDLLHKDYELQQDRDRKIHESSFSTRIAELRAAHESDLKIKKRLTAILPDYEAYRDRITAKSADAFNKKKAKATKKMEEEKAKRKAEVEAHRAEIRERRQQEEEAAREAEEEERRRAEEEARREEEEAAAREAEAARVAEEAAAKEEAESKRREERNAERAKLDEVARKQRERDEEIERRSAERAAARRDGAAAPTRPVVGSSGWRREGAQSPAAREGASSPAPVAAGTTPPAVPGIKPGGWRERAAAAQTSGGTPAAASAPVAAATAATPAAAPGSQAGGGERPRFALQPRSGSAAGGGWREKEAARQAAGGANANGASAGKEDEFQPVKKGAYQPPGARGGSRW